MIQAIKADNQNVIFRQKRVTKVYPIVTILRKLLENVFYQNERVIQVRDRNGIQETGDLTQKINEGRSQDTSEGNF